MKSDSLNNILQRIVAEKRKEVEIQRLEVPIYQLMESPRYGRSCFSAREALLSDNASGIIAEFKRASPSKGIINSKADVQSVVMGYQKAGASMVSVLTDEMFFGAQRSDFEVARKNLTIPMLRKDFMIDPYQIFQSKAMGADVVLLIAAVMTPQRCNDLAFLAHDLGMEVLLELHDESELEYVNNHVDLVGINNRNLKDFSVDIQRSMNLAKQLPQHLVRVAESGLNDVLTVRQLRDSGFNAFLMGEHFMSTPCPEEACERFVCEIRK